MKTTDMNHYARRLLQCLAAIFVAAMLAWASRADYNEEVLAAMPPGAYELVSRHLGGGATETQIVDEYMRHRERWDEEARRHAAR